MAFGRAEVAFEQRSGETRLAHLYQSDPLRVLFPAPGPGEPLTGSLVTTSGGLVGGDSLAVAMRAGSGTSSRVVGQAAEKVYRSAGHDVRIDVELEVADGAWHEWLPQETIVFDAARLRRKTSADVSPQGRLLAGEIVVLGRTAMGERVRDGLVRDAWEVRSSGRLIWSDAFHLDGDFSRYLHARAGLDGAIAFASTVYVGSDAADLLPLARELLSDLTVDEDLRRGATCTCGVLVVRWIDREAARLRDAYGEFWSGFRREIAELPAVMPRLWAI
jgi:urease accessory protein